MTYRVAGTFDIPREIVDKMNEGIQEDGTEVTEWLTDHIHEEDACDWEYDITLMDIVMD
jgi:hemerythrin